MLYYNSWCPFYNQAANKQQIVVVILGIKQQIWHSQQLILSDQVVLQIQLLILTRKRRNKAKQQ